MKDRKGPSATDDVSLTFPVAADVRKHAENAIFQSLRSSRRDDGRGQDIAGGGPGRVDLSPEANVNNA
ncbi:hypothetical protein GGQ80_000181 [Sphingomonas jinjuensis]|uniref:Uncharacterized protein n=1 Tax=Sphingomonas jinjuensis TaxID=535907 RepID=A0A840FG28_9SPHN|nr:hypothetical protein [Sphingomonas jinjuensis]MBB4152305.1 hypothetical protein [Sphingomonas jinjuensis]